MKILSSPNELNSEFKRLLNNYNEYLWTIAWADYDFELSTLLKKHKSRIQKISVGLHFYGTNPDFLEQFYKHSGVRFIEQNSGTFHPKLYLFQNNKNDWELLIGSSNFTKSAFNANTEVAMLLSSKDEKANESYIKAMNFINEQWKLGKILTDDYVKEYRKNKSKFKNRTPKLPTNGIRQQVFEKSWSEYLVELKKEKFKNRIKFLDWSREFLVNNKFNEIDLEMRKAIAGFGKSQSEEFGVDIGCFGTTVARGYFKQTVNKKPEIIAKAFSKIPLKGLVTKNDYDNFIEEFKKVSKSEELACATRMLCLWRPDYFINFNGKNEIAMCNELKINKSKVNYNTYWDLVVQPFINTNWANEANPKSNEDKKIFNYRVALLDCIYYKWT